MKARPKPMNHPLVAGRVRTMALIFSVTVPKVWPGPITGVRSISVGDLYCSDIRVFGDQLLASQLRIRIFYFCQVGGARPGVQFPEQAVISGLRLPPGNGAVGIVNVAENDRVGRAGL